MGLLFKLTDEDFGITPQEMNNYHIRLAARGKENIIYGNFKSN